MNNIANMQLRSARARNAFSASATIGRSAQIGLGAYQVTVGPHADIGNHAWIEVDMPEASSTPTLRIGGMSVRVCVSESPDPRVRIGCTTRTLTEWLSQGEEIAIAEEEEQLVATAEVTSIDTGDDPTVTLTVATTNASGVTVFSGEAVASINN